MCENDYHVLKCDRSYSFMQTSSDCTGRVHHRGEREFLVVVVGWGGGRGGRGGQVAFVVRWGRAGGRGA